MKEVIVFVDYFVLKSIGAMGLFGGGLMSIFAQIDVVQAIGALTALVAAVMSSLTAYNKIKIDLITAKALAQKTLAEAEATKIENERARQAIEDDEQADKVNTDTGIDVSND